MYTVLLSVVVVATALVGYGHGLTVKRCKSECTDKECLKEDFDTTDCKSTPYGSYWYEGKEPDSDDHKFKIYYDKQCRVPSGGNDVKYKDRKCGKDHDDGYTVAYLGKVFTFKDGEANYQVRITLCKASGSDKTKSTDCTNVTITEDQFDNGCYTNNDVIFRAYRSIDADRVTFAYYSSEAECHLDMLPRYYIDKAKPDGKNVDIYGYLTVDTSGSKGEPQSAELVIKTACESNQCGGCGAEEVYKATGECVKDNERGGSYEASCVPGVDTSYEVRFYVDDACTHHLNSSDNNQVTKTDKTSKKCDFAEELPPSLLLTYKTDKEEYLVCPADSDCSLLLTSNGAVVSPRKNHYGKCGPLTVPEKWCGTATVLDHPFYIRRTFAPYRMSFYSDEQQCLEDIAPVFVLDAPPLPSACAPLKRGSRTLCRGAARHTRFSPPADGAVGPAAVWAVAALVGLLMTLL